MNKIAKIVVSVVILVLFFTVGLWVGFSYDALKEYFSAYGNSQVESAQPQEEEDAGLIDSISGSIKKTLSTEPIEEALNLINADALHNFTKEELQKAAIEGMLSILGDKYSEYFTADEYEKIMDSFQGTMSGIGIIVMQEESGRIVVVKPLPDTPAGRSGIMEGDVITGVNGIDTSGMVLENVVAMIRGEEGTSVDVTFYRSSEDKTYTVTLVREDFYVPNVYAEKMEGGIGYIQYTDFQTGGADLLDSELGKLVDQGAEVLILDLRYNPGGTLNDAVYVCDLFIDEGTIATVRGGTANEESIDEYLATAGKYTEIPLIVLINEFSASASELTAGALKDHDRALIIGETSYGKGVVQSLYGLSDGSGLKFTSAKYYLPSGVSIDEVGVIPDIVVEMTPDDTEDLQLERALEEAEKIIEGMQLE